jgi:hypothetical protein
MDGMTPDQLASAKRSTGLAKMLIVLCRQYASNLEDEDLQLEYVITELLAASIGLVLELNALFYGPDKTQEGIDQFITMLRHAQYRFDQNRPIGGL